MSRKNKHLSFLRQLIKAIFVIPVILIRYSVVIIKQIRNKLIEKLRFSLTFKITAVYAFIILRILLLLGIIILSLFTLYLGWDAERYVSRDSLLVSYYIKESEQIPEDSIKRIAELDNIAITLFDENHDVIYTTDEYEKSPIFYDKDGGDELLSLNDNYMLVKERDQFYLDSYGRYKRDNFGYALVSNNKALWNSKNVYIQIKNKLVGETLSIGVLALILSGVDIILIIIILIAGSRASRKTLRPIETMTRTVENITINALDTRLDIRGSQDELKDLARTVNGMLDRIQQSYEQQNQFVSDASHELRTPISVIQGYANMLDRWGKNDQQVLKESISALKTESEDMKDLVEKLLFLARADKNTQKIEIENFYINELVEEVIKETKLIDDTHEITSCKNECALLSGDRKLVKEALRIVIDNSIKYTPDGGKIKIDSILSDKKVMISVEDTGAGISKEDLPHIFDRFYRADKSRTRQTGGTGLGLSIAKWIILKHNGSINVQSQVNAGTKVDILLPCRPSDQP